MKHAAKPLAAASLLAGASCCFGGSGACVIADGAPRCEPMFEAAAVVCPWSPPEVDAPPATCPGAFHDGETCPDVGYTIACDGYYVRPGTPCR